MQTQPESDNLNRFIVRNFRAREFLCKCCMEEGIKKELVDKIQDAHDMLPEHSFIFINSGYRCQKHNEIVGSVPDSAHTKGLAADIKCEDSKERFNLVTALFEVGFTRMGIGRTFIHVDLDKTKPRNAIWTY